MIILGLYLGLHVPAVVFFEGIPLYKEYQELGFVFLFYFILLFFFLLFFFRSSLWTWALFFCLLYYLIIVEKAAGFSGVPAAPPLINYLCSLFLFLAVYYLAFLFFVLIIRSALSFIFYNICLFFQITPKISTTEKTALTVGQPWIEKNFLTGCLEIKNLLSQKFPVLSKTEQDFLNQQTEELCSFSSEWDFLKRKKLNLKEEDFLKKQKFLGLNIPKKYGGWDFSAFAHAKVVEKIASHNVPLSILTMVPNSLSPAKLLLQYGTEAQKEKYLRDLCLGEKWPCFGLTEPQAGSDASSHYFFSCFI